ncbi:hypothetical protein [Jiella pelagia]|uniref:Uncharacterized protein n=1 Tax=Jiella pelagia TaxID=2986949 RepID=A0ABY7C104_9HYPH|nr:hypothetical protein [Jiella pelagia]WAP68901.1 hypothetical protein OH818_27435 [Jiella pelagia]
MAKSAAKDAEPAEAPATSEERAESRTIARAHISACRAALIAAGIRAAPPRRRHIKQPAPDDGGSDKPTDGDKVLAAIAQGLTRHCRRGDCRRDFTCRFGARRDDSDRLAPPCLKRLPQEALEALRFGAMRLKTPEAFRDGQLLKTEAAVIRRRAADAAARALAKDGGEKP